MPQLNSNNRDNNNGSQETWQQYLARISAKGYQSPLVHPDDSPLTLQEHLQLILNDIDEASPAEPLGKLRVDALKAQSRIADSHDTWPDYTDVLGRIADGIDELAEAVRENNHLLRGGGNAKS